MTEDYKMRLQVNNWLASSAIFIVSKKCKIGFALTGQVEITRDPFGYQAFTPIGAMPKFRISTHNSTRLKFSIAPLTNKRPYKFFIYTTVVSFGHLFIHSMNIWVLTRNYTNFISIGNFQKLWRNHYLNIQF